MSFDAIGSSIKAVLDTVQAAPGSRLATVYNHNNPDAGTGYPYATLTPKGSTEESLDTASNQALYSFIIRAIDVNTDKSAMETRMRKLADDILGELRKRAHITFDGTVDRVLPFTVSWWWDTANQTPSRFFEIEVQVLKDFFI